MLWGPVLASCIVMVGCGVASQPENARTVAAFEIPLPTENERAEFLSLLSQVAQAEGLHVDASSREELEHGARASPLLERTIRAGVWRGADDNELEASVMDLHDNLGQVWIMFTQGENPALADQFRERVMREIRRRWPETLSLPIMPTGAIPLPEHLVRTPDGYVVDPAASSMYGLHNDKEQ